MPVHSKDVLLRFRSFTPTASRAPVGARQGSITVVAGHPVVRSWCLRCGPSGWCCASSIRYQCIRNRNVAAMERFQKSPQDSTIEIPPPPRPDNVPSGVCVGFAFVAAFRLSPYFRHRLPFHMTHLRYVFFVGDCFSSVVICILQTIRQR